MRKVIVMMAFLNLSSLAFSDSTSLTTYYPAPIGSYERIRLQPHVGAVPPLCTTGELMVDDTNNLRFCSGGSWDQMNTWEQTNNKIVLGDAMNPGDKKVGIGTQDPIFMLHLKNNGGILAEGPAVGQGDIIPDYPAVGTTALLWYPRKAALRSGPTSAFWNDANIGLYSIALGGPLNKASGEASTVLGTTNTATANYSSVVGGSYNDAAGEGSTISGGYNNSTSATGLNAFIGAGYWNEATGANSVVTGGYQNQATADRAFVGGGGGAASWEHNIASAQSSTVAGGTGNTVASAYGAILGGFRNSIGATSERAVVVGGDTNAVSGTSPRGVIVGGESNAVSAVYGSILGGFSHEVKGYAGTVGGGYNNTANGLYNTIAGGSSNTSNGDYTTIVGGYNNNASGLNSFIGAGEGNKAFNDYCMVLGGLNNSAGDATAVRPYASVLGGTANKASGSISSIVGGAGNEITTAGTQSAILSGQNQKISGQYSVILGGAANTISGNNSAVLGQSTDLSGSNTFVWNVNESGTVDAISTSNAFLISPTAGPAARVGIGIEAPVVALHVNGTIKANLASGVTGSPVFHNTSTKDIGYDVAEVYEASEEVESGDVLIVDEEQEMKLKKSDSTYDRRVLGIVSTAPAILFEGSELQIAPQAGKFEKGTKIPVALAGRVPCKVSLENGPIKPGDLLTSSSVPGHAMKASDSSRCNGAVVGKALQSFMGGLQGEGTGTISVFVTLQ